MYSSKLSKFREYELDSTVPLNQAVIIQKNGQHRNDASSTFERGPNREDKPRDFDPSNRQYAPYHTTRLPRSLYQQPTPPPPPSLPPPLTQSKSPVSNQERVPTQPKEDDAKSHSGKEAQNPSLRMIREYIFEKSDEVHDSQKSKGKMSDSPAMECHISQNVDMTVHIQLETKDDISEDLEKFSRLCRIGHFNAAKQYFSKFLKEHETNPLVSVQYAQMLFDSRNYRELNDYEPLTEFAAIPEGALQRNWALLKSSSMYRSYYALDFRKYEARCHECWEAYLQAEDKCSSTELQSLVFAFNTLGYMFRFYNGEKKNVVWDAYEAIPLSKLLARGQVWDYRDLFISLISLDPRLWHLPVLFGERTILSLFETVMSAWGTNSYDEATNLALIDIAESMLFSTMLHGDLARLILYQTTDMISSMLRFTPSLILSRQYFRWLVIKSAYELDGAAGLSQIDQKTDHTVILFEDNILSLPIIIPSVFGFMGTRPRKPRPGLVANIKVALEGARTLGDYETEEMCLKTLIFESEESETLYDELSNLQKDVQHDIQGCLQTYLSQYMTCADLDAATSLYRKIMKIRVADNFPVVLRWARALILRALSATRSEASHWLREAVQCAAEQDMADQYVEFMRSVEESHMKEINYTFEGSRGVRKRHMYDEFIGLSPDERREVERLPSTPGQRRAIEEEAEKRMKEMELHLREEFLRKELESRLVAHESRDGDGNDNGNDNGDDDAKHYDSFETAKQAKESTEVGQDAEVESPIGWPLTRRGGTTTVQSATESEAGSDKEA